MRINRRLFINLMGVLFLGLLTVGWVVTRLVGAEFVDRPFRVTVDFAGSGGAFTNQEVTYRGVLVGQIGDMELNDQGGVDVELVIDDEWEGKIPEDVIASVHSKSAVGEQFVNLTPVGDVSGEALSDGDRIARAQTELPVDFQDLLASLDRVLADIPPEQTARVITNLARGLEGRQEEIAAIIGSLATLSDSFADVADEQISLIENAAETGVAFDRTKENFAAAIRAADEVFAGIGDEPEELKTFLAQNDRLARKGIALLARRGGDLAAGFKSLKDFVSYQLDQRGELIKTLEYVPEFLHAVEDASVPWRAPDGSEFYRIRTGLIVDNVRTSWPCKYVTPEDYERLPHVRDPKRLLEETRCEERAPSTVASPSVKALVAALKTWAVEHEPEQTEDVARSSAKPQVASEETVLTPNWLEDVSGWRPRP